MDVSALPKVTKFKAKPTETMELPEEITAKFKNSITIFVNGRRHDITNVAPDVLLAHFLRSGECGDQI